MTATPWPSDTDLLQLVGGHFPPDDARQRSAYFDVMLREAARHLPEREIQALHLLSAYPHSIAGQVQDHMRSSP